MMKDEVWRGSMGATLGSSANATWRELRRGLAAALAAASPAGCAGKLAALSLMCLCACGPAKSAADSDTAAQPGASAAATAAGSSSPEVVVVRGWQIDPGHKDYGLYQLTLSDGTLYGRILSVRNTHSFEGIEYETSTEYWALKEDPAPLKQQEQYTLTGKNGLWDDFSSQVFPGEGLLPVFSTPEQIEFSGGQQAPADIFCTNDTERNVCLDINVSYDDRTRNWSGTLRWFHTGDPVPDGLLVRLEHGDGETTTAFSLTAQPSGQPWSFGQGVVQQ